MGVAACGSAPGSPSTSDQAAGPGRPGLDRRTLLNPAYVPIRAHSAGIGVPAHEVGQWYYDGYGLSSRPPKSMRPYANVTCTPGEEVAWRPSLYGWNGASWVPLSEDAPWYHAVTGVVNDIVGFCSLSWGATWIDATGRPIMDGFGYRFGRLQVGWYAIEHHLYWNSLDRYHDEWSAPFQVFTA